MQPPRPTPAPNAGVTDSDTRFLAEPRIGVLITSRDDGRPLGVPVWFDWNGAAVEMFSAADAPKTRRLRRAPHGPVGHLLRLLRPVEGRRARTLRTH